LRQLGRKSRPGSRLKPDRLRWFVAVLRPSGGFDTSASHPQVPDAAIARPPLHLCDGTRRREFLTEITRPKVMAILLN
jgi:hypothetical protein